MGITGFEQLEKEETKEVNMKPNVIFILADDMGYGDVSCYNNEGKIPTPNIDRIAREGLMCRGAHSTSAVCTPSRYSILTGRYCWRKMAKGIVELYGDAIIPESRMTVANLFKDNGYRTGCIGKWHLGMTWQMKEDGTPDFTKPVLEGPTVNGFDEYFGVDVPNWPPYTYMEGKNVVEQPTEWFYKNGGNETVSIDGPSAPNWNLEQILPDITERACQFITTNSQQKQPFFLYFPLTSPHTPLAVADEWKGKSGLNLYADFVLETDAMVGKVLDCLRENGIDKDTWILFAADNGCARYIGCDELESKGHFPSYHWRGYKADAWDGGHRIPFVMRWPECIQPGSCYDGYISLGDFMKTAADILGVELPDSAAEDSISFYKVMKSEGPSERDVIIHHSINGKFAIRKGQWKLILCAGSGGFEGGIGGYPSDKEAAQLGLPKYQLYDLSTDAGEQNNLYEQNPKKAEELLEILKDYIKRGRSTPGEDQENDITCIIDPEIDEVSLLDD